MSVFANIIGHEPILRVLTHALTNPAHAYLFCGPRSVGKMTVAEQFAAALFGYPSSSSRAQSDGERDLDRSEGAARSLMPRDDEGAKKIELNTHPDFIRLAREEGAREIVVKQARELLARMQLTSAHGGYKIALIEEADRLNEEAANALLKAVEEPSKNTVYLFVAEQPDRLPATLRSRLVKMEFGRVPTKTIEDWLFSSLSSSQTLSDPPSSSRAQSDGERDLDPSEGAARSLVPRDDEEGKKGLFKNIATESRGCPGAAFHLAFGEEKAWFTSMDWNRLAATLLSSPLGQQLQAIEKLTQTIDSQPDPETAWREALEHLMRALDQAFIDQPQAAARLGQGLSHAWKLVGGAIPPRLAIEYALIPKEAKQGRMRPRILP